MHTSQIGADIADRLLRFGCNILWLCKKIPRLPHAHHVSGQLARSGTAPGALYEEARGAESRADFIHKLNIALKELRESTYWLKLARHSCLLPAPPAEKLMREANELIGILTSSIKTAHQNARR